MQSKNRIKYGQKGNLHIRTRKRKITRQPEKNCLMI